MLSLYEALERDPSPDMIDNVVSFENCVVNKYSGNLQGFFLESNDPFGLSLGNLFVEEYNTTLYQHIFFKGTTVC